MRRLAVAAALSIVALSAPAVGAQQGCSVGYFEDRQTGERAEVVRCSGTRSGTGLELLPGGGVGVDPSEIVYMPRLVDDGSGGTCITFDVLVYEGGPPIEILIVSNGTYVGWIVFGYSVCPGVPVFGEITPEAWVLEYLSEHGPDDPELVIQPGRMFVGLRAFLETGSEVSWLDEADSPFGQVLLTGTAEITVDGATSRVWTTARSPLRARSGQMARSHTSTAGWVCTT